MTRYTKLEGRRGQLNKSTAEEATDRKRKAREEEDEERAEGSEEGAKLEAEPSAAAAQASKSKETVTSKSKVDDDNDPGKLLKRAKLLRLKAKKAKTPEKKAELEQLRRDTENRAHALNGLRGASRSKAERSDRTSNHAYAERMASRVAKKSLGQEEAGPSRQAQDANAAPVNPWKAMEAERRANDEAKNAHRRDKRAAERAASLMCFACRQTGHAAKDCPQNGQNATTTGDGGAGACCYRCGSTQHTLGKCPKPQSAGLPYAQCYICNKQGHLASQCADNGGRGIYPRGGCCKVCSSVEHLANDCPQDQKRKRPDNANDISLSGKRDARPVGADDDDFHAEAAAQQGTTSKKSRKNAEASGPSASKARKVVAF